MPQRFLRPGITNSELWNSVPFESQSFFIRILTLVDDFGQYDARPAILWGQCFQIWNLKNPDQAINLQQVAVMLQQLAASRLIGIYEGEDGKQFLQVSQWHERVREGCKRKWPVNAKLQQVAAECSKLLPPSSPPSPSPSPSPTPSPTPEIASRDDLQLPEKLKTKEFLQAWEQWQKFRRSMKKVKDWTVMFQSQIGFLSKFDAVTAAEMLNQSVRNGWQGLFELKTNSAGGSQGKIPRSAQSPEDRAAEDARILREAIG